MTTPAPTETSFLLKGTTHIIPKDTATPALPGLESAPAKKTSKRPLFQDEPEDQQKKKRINAEDASQLSNEMITLL
ncbi:hypothetical protein Tco_0943810 [Tanacetum coccineum]